MKSPVGQLLIVGFEGTELSPQVSAMLKEVQPAGVILFARNIASPQQTRQLLRNCQKLVELPLLTCVDLEGGTVDRFRKVLGPTPSPVDVFATRSRKLYRNHGCVIGENCRALGFDVDFAPVLDLACEASKSVMDSRAVSNNPDEVIVYAREFLRGLADAGVIGCGKHFPGLGETTLDTHVALPSVMQSLRKLWNRDLVPYRKLQRSLPMIMVSHADFPLVTGKATATPASLSRKWITDILRKKMGYTGLVCSDDLEMGAVLAAAPIEQAFIGHIRAGGDLGLICHRLDFILQTHAHLIREIDIDRALARRAEQASRRVISFKRARLKKGVTSGKKLSATRINHLTRQLWEFSEEIRLSRVVTRSRK